MDYTIPVPFWGQAEEAPLYTLLSLQVARANGTQSPEGTGFWNVGTVFVDPADYGWGVESTTPKSVDAYFRVVSTGAYYSGTIGIQRYALAVAQHASFATPTVHSFATDGTYFYKTFKSVVTQMNETPTGFVSNERWISFIPPETADASLINPGVDGYVRDFYVFYTQ